MKRKRKVDALQFGDPRCAEMHAGVYVRKSTKTEGRSASRDEQMELCADDAKLFGFASVTHYIEDEGQKGEWFWDDGAGRNPTPHRPVLTKMVNDIKAGRIQAVLVYKQDRLVRDPGVGDGLNKLFQQTGARYICRGRDSEIDTARGMYQTSVDTAAARLWRDQISEDIIRDLDYKFAHCQFTRNPACFGWRSAGLKSRSAIPNYEELKVVVRIFRMFLGIGQAALGPYQIARVLEKEGVRIMTGSKGHKSKNPKKVYGSSIRQILENPMYAGHWQHNGETKFYEQLMVAPPEGGEKKTVIPDAWHFAAKDKLTAPVPTGRKAVADEKLLSGLLICAACGRNMHCNSKYLKSGGRTLRWICPHRSGPTRECWGESYASIVVDELDNWAVEHLAPHLLFEISSMTEEADAAALDDDVRTLESQVTRLREMEMKALKSALLGLDEEQVAALAQQFRADRLDLERRLQDVRRQIEVRSARARTHADLSSEDPLVLKAALRRFVRWIAVSDSGVTVLTSLNTFVGAQSVERDLTLYGSADNRRRLGQPSPCSVALCPTWIRDPDEFVKGRRYALGDFSRAMTDEELLPGVWAQVQELNAA